MRKINYLLSYCSDIEQEIRRKLTYDPVSGIFTRKTVTPESWSDRVFNSQFAGKEVGKPINGYQSITIKGKRILAHRMAWFIVTGQWPQLPIDHINRIKTDNRFSNLREATLSENQQNSSKHKNNTSGVTGVRWYPPLSKWLACIRAHGKYKHLGYFEEFDAAVKARLTAERDFGFSPTHGRAT